MSEAHRGTPPISIHIVRLARAGWILWGVLLLAVCAMVVADADVDGLMRTYARAAMRWWHQEDLYRQQLRGFLYLPPFAVIFTPFWLLGPVLGGVLWRLVSVAMLVHATWRLCGRLSPAQATRMTGLLLLLSLPAAGAAVRNGQATVAMFALMIYAADFVILAGWRRAAACLAGAVALKPIAAAPFLLFGAVFARRLALALAISLAVFLALPFLHPDPGYVARQYRLGLEWLMVAGNPGQGRWADLGMLVATIHRYPPDAVMLPVRLAAALATLALGVLAVRRCGRAWGTVHLLALAVCYLMLFSPRTESNTYIMLAMVAGFYAAAALLIQARRRWAWLYAGIALGLGTEAYGSYLFRVTGSWWKPLLACLFLVALAHEIVRPAPPETKASGAA